MLVDGRASRQLRPCTILRSRTTMAALGCAPRTRQAGPVSSQLTFMILSLCFGLVLKKTDT